MSRDGDGQTHGNMQTTHGPATFRRSKRAALPPLGHASKEGTHAQTTDNTCGTPTVGVRPLPSATSPRGDERDMDQAAMGRGSNKQQGSAKHKGRGKSEHTDRDLSLGHMRVRHHTSCVRTRLTAVNNTRHARARRKQTGADGRWRTRGGTSTKC
eukprot:scaffold14825_cov123-Isochrysis_galbana.AAC.7